MRLFFSLLTAVCLVAVTANAGDVQADLDSSVETLKSCDAMKLAPAMEGILIVSWRDGSKICEVASASLGRPMPVGVFRTLLRVAALMNSRGVGEMDKVAYQLAEVIDARGLTDPKRMDQTLVIAFKTFSGSNGRVTPKDLNVAVRHSGRGPSLSDDDLYTMAAIISVRKRNNGE